ncbi:glycoside hydrolase family 65 protein [Salinimicrobium sp. MT39]|uniref:Glycoside hydrolase family 65 protein n=1 Tax=Salinimicrobium profundisediminis TaxID=2994553 RepID=A0A9X3I1V9_9FLAO|nr:glycosyl hydrolase family 65 protein [Salinimicrobium profundisediminis]MCX2838342.1 glycoside hydrolase family 65 protein [Salinimicrobium profundisediminis]
MQNWKLKYDGLRKEQEGLREALCTLGNGYFATRGAAEESKADGTHYPGIYLAGGYNRLKSQIAGKTIENEDLVNWPNWLHLSFRLEGDKNWFQLEKKQVLNYVQELDISAGILRREMHFIDEQQRETRIISTRLVSMDNPHLAAIKWDFVLVNWSGMVEVRSTLDGSTKNEGVKRYKPLKNQHLKIIKKGEAENAIYILVQTNQSLLYMAQAAKCVIFSKTQKLDVIRKFFREKEVIGEIFTFHVTLGEQVSIEKTVSLFTSKDDAISEPLNDALKQVNGQADFSVVKRRHSEAWKRLWNKFDIFVNASGNSQLLLRLHIFHLLQTASKLTIGRDVGLPARGWHGEAYRGHIFWDELFIFPILNYRLPDLTRSLLLYRYKRLEEAKKLAKREGYDGAMFPWQSGSNGREESQVVHLNPKSGQWVPDNTYLQRHVNLSIAYNIWQYYEVTADKNFMKFYGAEMLIEIARLFTGLASWSDSKQRYEIRKVVGPDEFHTAYPGSDRPGINNNAYTNVMASWLFSHSLKAFDLIGITRRDVLKQELQLDDRELEKWKEIGSKLYIPFIEEGIIAQFEGYEQLEDFEWEAYRKKYNDIHRLDRILDAEGDSVNRYKASKQADVLMLFYLFSSEQLVLLFKGLGYDFTPSNIPDNIKYYGTRTSDGSTLSRIVRSWVVARSDRKCAWHCFREALVSDFEDVQGGTTPEGIHLGAMAGTIDIVQRCFTGLEIRNDVLWLNPQLPKEINSLSMKINYRGVWLQLNFSANSCRIEPLDEVESDIKIQFKKQSFTISNKSTKVIQYQQN